jgi:hypothetical protein
MNAKYLFPKFSFWMSDSHHFVVGAGEEDGVDVDQVNVEYLLSKIPFGW